MADESINSSPQKLSRSIHRSRLSRKTKRLNATSSKLAEGTSSNQTTLSTKETFQEDLSCTLLVMYDSEECAEVDTKAERSRSSTEKTRFQIADNYDPFVEQRLLHLADRCRPPPRSSVCFIATQCFEPCNNFLFQQAESTTVSRSSNKDVFEITDSELLQVCEETEKKSVKANIEQERTEVKKEPTTPDARQKPKSIVDLILEDFCSSPASPEPQQSSEESSFHFRFANQPLRTYSRRRQENTFARKNIAEQYVQADEILQHCIIDDDLLSNDSDLSVQEDHTQIRQAADVGEIVNLQHSQKLCENLQNLSAYFSELSGEINKKQGTCGEKSPQDLAETKNQNVAQSSADKCLGTYCTLLKKESNNYQRDELEELNNIQKQCLNGNGGHISAEEDFKGFSSEDEDNRVGMEPMPDQNCDIVKNEVHELDSLNGDDEWNDECDFFANFDMDEALDAVSTSKLDKSDSDKLISEVECNAEPTAGFCTASNKAVMISAEAKALANKILRELPPLPTNTSCTDDFIMNDAEEKPQCALNQTITISKHMIEKTVKRTPDSPQERSILNPINPSTNLYDGLTIENNKIPSFMDFCKASNKKITISKDTQQYATEKLEKLPPLQNDHTFLASASTSKESFVGFRTASSKAIKISKEAQERASKILEKLPELNVVEHVETSNRVARNAPSNSIFGVGFRTASSKVIRISEEAQKRAVMIMQDVLNENVDHIQEECLENMQFSEWPAEGEAQMELNTKSTANLPVFSTASKKPNLVSESVKQKATATLEKLSKLADSVPSAANFGIPENVFEAEPFENIVFSEWPLADASEGAQENHSISSNKRKHEDMDLLPNDEEPSSSQHTPKLICKSVSIQRSPLAHIQQSGTCSSLRELAVKTPPDYRSSRGIIARKNLLSLNKRTKSKAKSLQQPEELNDEGDSVKTPTKMGNIAEPKTPPITPNLREFFASACVSTSTPHPPLRQETRMQTRAKKRAELEAAVATVTETTTPTKGASLKRIECDNETLNKSASALNVSRLSNSSCSNITKLESNPTPKQRIERLRMYGKPPSLSPIYMSSTNNCRISGLKRHLRSATKDKQ